jgi:hypothetical protein
MSKGTMKKVYLLFFVFYFLFSPGIQIAAQSNQGSSNVFDTTGFPQWAKDLRRWDIVAFGLFPFSMFFVTFATDMVRWNDANGMDFSEEGRRYAPWPLKSAGAIEMTTDEYQTTILRAAALSLSVALIDLAIVNIRRRVERRRIESMPAGTVTIDRVPISVQQETKEPDDNIINDEFVEQ